MNLAARRYKQSFFLLVCIFQLAVLNVSAQTTGLEPELTGSEKLEALPIDQDSISEEYLQTLDSLDFENNKKIAEAEAPLTLTLSEDSLPPPIPKKQWIPNPTRATWLAVIFPGAGQIYNRKFWKLPIIYGGFAGCAYALGWNTQMYKDYSQAYRDIMDDNPATNSYEDLLPPGYRYSESQLKTSLKKRKDMFRRYRDISIFAFIGVYIISVVDAYVDAELSNFDITPDLSMRLEPAVINNQGTDHSKSVGMQCSLRF